MYIPPYDENGMRIRYYFVILVFIGTFTVVSIVLLGLSISYYFLSRYYNSYIGSAYEITC